MRPAAPQSIRISDKETLEWPTSEPNAKTDPDLERLAHWLDSVFEIPGLRLRPRGDDVPTRPTLADQVEGREFAGDVVGLIVGGGSRGDEPDIYRTVLKKENGQWVIKAKPTISLSAKVYPDVPFEILSTINRKGRF